MTILGRKAPPILVNPQVASLRKGLMVPVGSTGLSRGPNLLVDGDMEAVGVAAWTALVATLTKRATAPAEGVQWLEVKKTGAGTGAAYQSVMTIGQTYRITGYARGDGILGVPRITVTGNGVVWLGVVSTAWQPIDITFVAQNAVANFSAIFGGAGTLAGYDDMYTSLEPS